MKPETVFLIQRSYQEVVDDVLTAIVGGVVNEPIIYDVKNDLYPLAEAASGVRGITGEIEVGDHHEHREFQSDIDFSYDSTKNAIVWLADGKKPADLSTFYVDYFRPDGTRPSPLTDINVGSVTRTLGEAIGREIATVYQQINLAYRSGFIDTATGKSLDFVVSILGVERKVKDFAVGLVTCFRNPSSQGSITIDAGVVLTTTKGDVIFETTEIRTLQRGQVRIDIPVRAAATFKGTVGVVPGGTITKLGQPVEGIVEVKNFDATFLGTEDESDEDLRLRAKAKLRGLGNATLLALDNVIREERATPVEIWDPNAAPARRTDPGSVLILVESEPERFPSLRGRVEETRAAGVQATLVARYIFMKPRVVVVLTRALSPDGQKKVLTDVIKALQEYVDGLGSGDDADGAEMLKRIKKVDDVDKNKTKIVDVMTWQSDVTHLGTDSLVDAAITAIQSVPPGDDSALRQAIDNAVSEVPPLLPSTRRIPNRSLVQASDSTARATDFHVEDSDFKVSATVNGEKWWIVLDMEPADIAVMGA